MAYPVEMLSAIIPLDHKKVCLSIQFHVHSFRRRSTVILCHKQYKNLYTLMKNIYKHILRVLNALDI